MIHRFESKADRERKVKIDLVQEFSHRKTIITYPKPDPRDRIDDEYDEDDRSE